MIAAVWLRVAVAAAAVAVLQVAAADVSPEVRTLVLLLTIVLAGSVALRPGSPAAGLIIVGSVLVHLVTRTSEIGWELVALVVLLPLVHQLAAVAAVTPLTGSIGWPAVRPSAGRYLVAVGMVGAGLAVAALLG